MQPLVDHLEIHSIPHVETGINEGFQNTNCDLSLDIVENPNKGKPWFFLKSFPLYLYYGY